MHPKPSTARYSFIRTANVTKLGYRLSLVMFLSLCGGMTCATDATQTTTTNSTDGVPLASSTTPAWHASTTSLNASTAPNSSTVLSTKTGRNEHINTPAPNQDGKTDDASSGFRTTSPVTSSARATALDDLRVCKPAELLTEDCHYDEQPVRGGIVVGATFDLHGEFDLATKACPAESFQQLEAVWKTQGILFARDYFLRDIQRRSPEAVGRVTHVLGAPLEDILGIQIRDTCSSPLLSVKYAVEWTAKTTPAQPDDKCTPRTQIILGPGDSVELASVAHIVAAQSIPQISFWATSTEFDNTDLYSFLFRSLPSDRYQIKAIVDVIEHFGWQYVALVASADAFYAGQGSNGVRLGAVQRSFCIEAGHEFTISRGEDADMTLTVHRLKADVNIRVIILFSLVEDATEFLNVMVRENYTDVILVGSEDWITRTNFTKFPRLPGIIGMAPRAIHNELLDSMIAGFKSMFKNETSLEHYWYRNPWLRAYLERSHNCTLAGVAQPLRCGEAMKHDGTYRGISCASGIEFVNDLSNLQGPRAVMEAVFVSMDAAFQSLLDAVDTQNRSQTDNRTTASSNSQPSADELCPLPDGNKMRCALRRVHVPCGDIQDLVPDSYKIWDGEGNVRCLLFQPESQSAQPLYWLLNVQRSATGGHYLKTIGHWQNVNESWPLSRRLTILNTTIDWHSNGSLASATDRSAIPNYICNPICPPGTRYLKKSESSCCWSCLPCPSRSISKHNFSESCTSCPDGQTATQSRTACEDIPGEFISISSAYGMLIITQASLGLAVLVTTAVLLWKHRQEPVIKACDVHLSMIILVASVIGFFSAMLALFDPSKQQCWLILLFCTPWTLICSATVLVKTYRLHRIFTSGTPLVNKKFMSTPALLTAIAVIVAIGEAIAVAAVLISSPSVERKVHGADTVHVVCQSREFTRWYGSIVAYNIFLIVITLGFAFRVRRLPAQFNEARLIFMSAFCTFIVWLALGPAFFITEGILQPFIIALSTSAQVWSLWACLFAPRLYQVVDRKQLAEMRAAASRALSSTFAHVIGVTPKQNQTGNHHRRNALAEQDTCVQTVAFDSSCSSSSEIVPTKVPSESSDISVFGDETPVSGRRSSRLDSPSIHAFPTVSPFAMQAQRARISTTTTTIDDNFLPE